MVGEGCELKCVPECIVTSFEDPCTMPGVLEGGVGGGGGENNQRRFFVGV